MFSSPSSYSETSFSDRHKDMLRDVHAYDLRRTITRDDNFPVAESIAKPPVALERRTQLDVGVADHRRPLGLPLIHSYRFRY
jgi:hypothetical protein